MANQLSEANVQRLRNLGINRKLLGLYSKVQVDAAIRSIHEYKRLRSLMENKIKRRINALEMMQTALRKMKANHNAPRSETDTRPTRKYALIGFGPGPLNARLIRQEINRRGREFTRNQNVEMFIRHFNAHQELTADIERITQELRNASQNLLRKIGSNIPQNNAALFRTAKNAVKNIELNKGRLVRNAFASAYHTGKLGGLKRRMEEVLLVNQPKKARRNNV